MGGWEELMVERSEIRDLVEALPKCKCGAPATRFFVDATASFVTKYGDCDFHYSEIKNEDIKKLWIEYPYAERLRTILKSLQEWEKPAVDPTLARPLALHFSGDYPPSENFYNIVLDSIPSDTQNKIEFLKIIRHEVVGIDKSLKYALNFIAKLPVTLRCNIIEESAQAFADRLRKLDAEAHLEKII